MKTLGMLEGMPAKVEISIPDTHPQRNLRQHFPQINLSTPRIGLKYLGDPKVQSDRSEGLTRVCRLELLAELRFM